MNFEITDRLVETVSTGEKTILAELPGGLELKRDMAATGRISRWLFSKTLFPASFLKAAAENPELWAGRRVKVARQWKRIFPFRAKGYCDGVADDRGKVIVINHPSLTDPLVALVWAILTFPNKPVLVPVNLPWFEEMSGFVSKLRRIDIILVPMLTPKTMQRLEASADLEKLKVALDKRYVERLLELTESGGMSIVAQSAGRQRHLWVDQAQRETGRSADGRKVSPTVGVLTVAAKRAKLGANTDIIPVGVTLPNWCWWGFDKLNLFIPYGMAIGKPVPMLELGARPDTQVLRSMENLIPVDYWYS
ncbi:MAG: hypothetical protein LBG75_00315 [Candidatus Nomurabacteria bacterium]|jgi:hypothetical protein|nr:hypothetical protein [Candidatus Nomurabacteria bacterium]